MGSNSGHVYCGQGLCGISSSLAKLISRKTLWPCSGRGREYFNNHEASFGQSWNEQLGKYLTSLYCIIQAEDVTLDERLALRLFTLKVAGGVQEHTSNHTCLCAINNLLCISNNCQWIYVNRYISQTYSSNVSI